MAWLRSWLSWQHGRQGTGYDKMLLAIARWPLAADCYLLRYPKGSAIPAHTDPVTGKRHYRLNIVIWQAAEGGDFLCNTPIFATNRIKLFRPDACEHAVSEVKRGSRYVLSIGWTLPNKTNTA
jgi:hypothetical protein